MAFYSHFLIFSALLLCLCSADEITCAPETMSPTDTTTFEPVGTITFRVTTGHTGSPASQPAETITTFEPSTVTDKVTSETTGQTHSPTSKSAETTTLEPSTVTEKVTTTTTGHTDGPTSQPAKTTFHSELTTTTVTTVSTTILPPTTPTGIPSPPPPEPTSTTPSITLPGQSTSVSTPKSTVQSTEHPGPPTTKATTLVTISPSTSTTQATIGPITTAEPLNCQNGGIFNGSICICVRGFSGTFCEIVETFEPVTLNRSVVVDLVINQEYSEKYENKSSPEYIEFVGNFTRQMTKYYQEKKVPHFKKVQVTRVSRGGPLVRLLDNAVGEMRLSDEALATHSVTPRAESVSVTHNVVLVIPNNASSEQLYTNTLDAVQEAADDLVGCSSGCPYNVTVRPTVKETKVDVRSVCQSAVEDPRVIDYYEIVPHNGALTCVTVCNSLHSRPKTCYNKGLCRVYRYTGPQCKCQNTDYNWYLDDDCRLPIQKTPFYAGLSVTLVFLVVTVVALTVYVLMNKHKQTQNRDNKESLVDQWLNEDLEWSRSNSSIYTYNAGEYRNPSFTQGESVRQPVPIYQLTQPSLDTANIQSSPSASTYTLSQTGNTSNAPISNERPASPLRNFSSNLPMRIGRPRIRTSWDA